MEEFEACELRDWLKSNLNELKDVLVKAKRVAAHMFGLISFLVGEATDTNIEHAALSTSTAIAGDIRSVIEGLEDVIAAIESEIERLSDQCEEEKDE